MSRACRARRVERVEPVELDASSVSSESSSSCRVCRAVLFDKLDTAEMHWLDTSNVSSRVVSRRDEPNGIWASGSIACNSVSLKRLHANMMLRRVSSYKLRDFCKRFPAANDKQLFHHHHRHRHIRLLYGLSAASNHKTKHKTFTK